MLVILYTIFLSERAALFLVIILYFFFASTFTFAKAALDYAPPLFLVAVRFLIAGLVLLSYYYTTSSSWSIKKRDYGLFVQAILFTFYLSFATDVWALQYISSAKACLIYNVAPFVTALLMYGLYGKKITSKQAVALLVAFVAFIPLLNSFSDSKSVCNVFFYAEIVLFISVIMACYGWIVLKQLVVDKNYSSVFVNGVGLTAGGIIALVHALIVEGLPTIYSHGAYQPPLLLQTMQKIVGATYLDIGMFVLYTLLLVLIAHIFCYNLYAHLLKKYSPTFLSLAGALTPLFAAFLGWIFLDEHLSWQFFATIIAVSLALFIFYKDELQREPILHN
jgi:drug/metabolite transporter (DMT)-like permease